MLSLIALLLTATPTPPTGTKLLLSGVGLTSVGIASSVGRASPVADLDADGVYLTALRVLDAPRGQWQLPLLGVVPFFGPAFLLTRGTSADVVLASFALGAQLAAVGTLVSGWSAPQWLPTFAVRAFRDGEGALVSLSGEW